MKILFHSYFQDLRALQSANKGQNLLVQCRLYISVINYRSNICTAQENRHLDTNSSIER